MRVNERMKKLLSIALTLCMVLAYVPSSAGATGTVNHTHDGSYVAPENPECTCAEKCEEANVWCDVCGVTITSTPPANATVAAHRQRLRWAIPFILPLPKL